jgi:hypothetical protein
MCTLTLFEISAYDAGNIVTSEPLLIPANNFVKIIWSKFHNAEVSDRRMIVSELQRADTGLSAQ